MYRYTLETVAERVNGFLCPGFGSVRYIVQNCYCLKRTKKHICTTSKTSTKTQKHDYCTRRGRGRRTRQKQKALRERATNLGGAVRAHELARGFSSCECVREKERGRERERVASLGKERYVFANLKFEKKTKSWLQPHHHQSCFTLLHDTNMLAPTSASSWCPTMDLLALSTTDGQLSLARLDWHKQGGGHENKLSTLNPDSPVTSRCWDGDPMGKCWRRGTQTDLRFCTT